jgi:hypothetical protein
MAKRKMTQAEREAREAEQARVLENAMRTRRLAETAQAKFDAEARERERAGQKPER